MRKNLKTCTHNYATSFILFLLSHTKHKANTLAPTETFFIQTITITDEESISAYGVRLKIIIDIYSGLTDQ